MEDTAFDATAFSRRLQDGGWSRKRFAESVRPPAKVETMARWLSGERSCPPYIQWMIDGAEAEVRVEERSG